MTNTVSDLGGGTKERDNHVGLLSHVSRIQVKNAITLSRNDLCKKSVFYRILAGVASAFMS